MAEEWSFCHVTDMHVGTPRSFRYQPAFLDNWLTARKQIVDLEPRFLLVGGDLGRDGFLHSNELQSMKADLDTLPFPYAVVPGNMDTGNKVAHHDAPGKAVSTRTLNITSETLQGYVDVFGAPWWSFEHGNVSVSGFCDMLCGSGLPEEAQMWSWLEQQRLSWRQRLRPEGMLKVWLLHYPLFLDRPDESSWDVRDPLLYLNWYYSIDRPHRDRLLDIMADTDAQLAISGHVHCRKHHRFEGISFDIAPATSFSQMADHWQDGDGTLGFMHYRVAGGGIEGRFVALEERSDASGYGPGGHVSPDKRDYSLAWEQD